MKKRLLAVCLAVFLFSGITAGCKGDAFALSGEDEILFMQYNILYAPTETQNKWSERKAALVNHIKKYSPAVLNLQEVVSALQLDYLKAELEGYTFVGRARSYEPEYGEGLYVAYRTELFTKLDDGVFWLSDTPDTVSAGWGGAAERIVVWVKLKHNATGREFYVYNVHFDTDTEKCGMKSLTLCRERIEQHAEPVLFAGDFNFDEEAPEYSEVTTYFDDTKTAAKKRVYTGRTYHGFESSKYNRVIDFVFMSQSAFKVKAYGVLKETQDDMLVSDHYAVLVRLSLE